MPCCRFPEHRSLVSPARGQRTTVAREPFLYASSSRAGKECAGISKASETPQFRLCGTHPRSQTAAVAGAVMCRLLLSHYGSLGDGLFRSHISKLLAPNQILLELRVSPCRIRIDIFIQQKNARAVDWNGFHTTHRTVAWTTGSTSILGWRCPFLDVGRRALRTQVFEPTGNGRVNVVWNSPVDLFQRLRQLQPCPRTGKIRLRLSRSAIGNDRNRHVAIACTKCTSWHGMAKIES